MIPFEASVQIYKFINAAYAGIGVILALYSLTFSIRTSGKSEGEKVKIARRSNRVTIGLGVLIAALGVAKYTQVFNVEDVFDGESFYVGQTLNGRANGFGLQYDLDGNLMYKGEFKANQYRGYGEWYHTWKSEENEDITYLRYEGEFKDSRYNGRGKLYEVRGDTDDPVLIYEGDFEDNLYSGNGKYYFEGGWYEGEFRNGMYNGKGKFYNSGKLVYEGDFIDGAKQGFGIEYDGDGNEIYRGTFVNNEKVE